MGKPWSKRTRPPGITVPVKELKKLVLSEQDIYSAEYDRPATRGDCIDGPRPCPWVSCKHHLFIDVDQENGSLKLNFPDREPWEIEHSCSLDLADRGGMRLAEVGEILNLTRERIRQLEERGLIILKRSGVCEVLR